MGSYLFVHFKEKSTPDGEQIYFGLSQNGFEWEQVNDGKPILETHVGDFGVRDHTITRTKEGKYIILATDLSLANHFNGKYKGSWECITHEGSKSLVKWESDDLLHWSREELVQVVDESYGCAWAPDIIYDEQNDDYIVHWSSLKKPDGTVCSYDNRSSEDLLAIYYARTKDFKTFSKAQLLTSMPGRSIIDSNIVYDNGFFYRFIKENDGQGHIYMEKGKSFDGEFERMPLFDAEMSKLQSGVYEAPTAYKLDDGRWCLMLDFYGTKIKEEQGYVPFVCEDITKGQFIRSDDKFSFPYGFKHGTVIRISDEKYNEIKEFFSK